MAFACAVHGDWLLRLWQRLQEATRWQQAMRSVHASSASLHAAKAYAAVQTQTAAQAAVYRPLPTRTTCLERPTIHCPQRMHCLNSAAEFSRITAESGDESGYLDNWGRLIAWL